MRDLSSNVDVSPIVGPFHAGDGAYWEWQAVMVLPSPLQWNHSTDAACQNQPNPQVMVCFYTGFGIPITSSAPPTAVPLNAPSCTSAGVSVASFGGPANAQGAALLSYAWTFDRMNTLGYHATWTNWDALFGIQPGTTSNSVDRLLSVGGLN